MSMSKAMAAECSGEVFLMTMTNLNKNAYVPENGIWWQVEFPALIDENRPENKKVTKVCIFPSSSPCTLAHEQILTSPVDHIPPSARN
jgi:hypothetical protein